MYYVQCKYVYYVLCTMYICVCTYVYVLCTMYICVCTLYTVQMYKGDNLKFKIYLCCASLDFHGKIEMF